MVKKGSHVIILKKGVLIVFTFQGSHVIIQHLRHGLNV